MQFFSNLFLRVDTALDSFYVNNIQNVMDYISPSIAIFGIILFVGIGITLMNGWTSQPAKPLLLAAVTLTAVSLLAGSVGIYNTYIADFLRGLPDELIALVSGGDGTVGATLDSFGDDVLTGIQKMWTNASGIAETAAIAVICAIFFIAWIIMSVSAAFSLMMAKIVLTILVTAGPFFIIFLMFPQTKEFFTKWFTYCVSFSVLGLVIGGVIAITSEIATGYFEVFSQTSQKIDFVAYAAPMLILFGLYKLFDNAPSIASSLSGGIGLAVGAGIASVASAATSPLRSGASKAGSVISRNIADKTEGTRFEKVGNLMDGERRQAKKSVRLHDKTAKQRQQNRQNKQQPSSTKDGNTGKNQKKESQPNSNNKSKSSKPENTTLPKKSK